MQCADIFYLGVDICSLGIDQEKVNMLAREYCDKIKKKFKATIIVGDGYLYSKRQNKKLIDVHFEFDIHKNPKNIALVMSQVDFAIISFGITAYEIAALKIPAIYLSITEDHFESSKLFVNHEIGVSLGIFPKVNPRELVEAVMFYLKENHNTREIFNCEKLSKIADLKEISSLILDNHKYV